MTFQCSVHPDSMAYQIAKCAEFHQLCGDYWTEAYKSGKCPCCGDVLKESMPKPIFQYRIDKYKPAYKIDFRHHLPNELLAEIVKFIKFETIPINLFKENSHFCRPKNFALLLANSKLCTFVKKEVEKADPFFEKMPSNLTTIKMMLMRNPRLGKRMQKMDPKQCSGFLKGILKLPHEKMMKYIEKLMAE